MSRVLTVAHARVAAADEAEYLDLLEVLTRRLAARGQHLWLFRERGVAGSFMEFTEGSDEATHRAAGPADPEEAAIEARLAVLATYLETRSVRWDEVSFRTTG
ncbi:MAG: hypothetical protein U0974_09165 [Gemmatimonadales bacterium]|nr:hypothetical protein [Gemmatimonadales bacterium]MDZ4389886.1 hypothetical protein [Gemmatimonadales bacterium]